MSGARPRADLIDYREYLTERQVAKLESIFLRYDRRNTGAKGAGNGLVSGVFAGFSVDFGDILQVFRWFSMVFDGFRWF